MSYLLTDTSQETCHLPFQLNSVYQNPHLHNADIYDICKVTNTIYNHQNEQYNNVSKTRIHVIQ